jgi:hypothetical protein
VRSVVLFQATQHPAGAVETTSSVALVASRVLPDSLFDSLLRTLCDTPGRSVAQTRQTGEYVRQALTLPGKEGQSPLNPKVQGSIPCASTNI